MKKPVKKLAAQLEALEALVGLKTLNEDEARGRNGGAASATTRPVIGPRPIKHPRGTGAIAQRLGTGAVAIRGTGAVAVRRGGGA